MELETYLRWNGYWGDGERRRRNGYTLSPSAYLASPGQEAELQRLARATYKAVGALNERLCGFASGAQHLSHEEAQFVRLANVASRGLLRPSDGNYGIPPVLKIDLAQTPKGHFQIAEVDAYNPRGFGYVALLEGGVPPIGLRRFPGMQGLVDIMRVCSRSGETYLFLISEFERFYEPAFEVLRRSLGARGILASLAREQDMAQAGDGVEGHRLFIIPDTLNAYPAVRDSLMQKYREGRLNTFYPPTAYLGSKAFLPFLRSCEGMEEFIPKTALVGKKCGVSSGVLPDELAILKATMSSGMKKVLFSDLDKTAFEGALATARSLKTPSWILQEQVPQAPVPVVIFDDEGNRLTQHYYLRITLYANESGVLDAEVTGRPDRKVHGAPDCIQIPVILS